MKERRSRRRLVSDVKRVAEDALPLVEQALVRREERGEKIAFDQAVTRLLRQDDAGRVVYGVLLAGTTRAQGD